MTSLVIEPTPRTDPKRAYCRTKSVARSRLERLILTQYKRDTTANSCVIFPSGMAAISAVLFAIMHSNFQKGDIVLIGNELYCDTPKCVETWASIFGAVVVSVGVTDTDAILEVFKKDGKRIKLFLLESCSNPSAQMFDWTQMAKLKQYSPQMVVCVDNTWLTNILFDPFSNGADIILESMSKYLSDGKCIGGFVAGPNKLLNLVLNVAKLNGQFVGADHCDLFSNAQSTLSDRMLSAGATTLKVLDAVQKLPGIKLMYPLMPTHPSFTIYLNSSNNKGAVGPSVFWMHIVSNCSRNDIQNVKYSFFKKETSYGAEYSKIDPWPQLGTSADYENNSVNMKPGVWLRVSVGYKDKAEKVIHELRNVIEYFQEMK